jgi:hypothetical protein
MDIHLLSYYIGIGIVVLSHIYTLSTVPSMYAHSVANLVAAACIAYYFMNKEGFIKM